MYAIVEISGKQFKVEKKQKLFVNRINTEEGKKVSFDNVLMFSETSQACVWSDLSCNASTLDGGTSW